MHTAMLPCEPRRYNTEHARNDVHAGCRGRCEAGGFGEILERKKTLNIFSSCYISTAILAFFASLSVSLAHAEVITHVYTYISGDSLHPYKQRGRGPEVTSPISYRAPYFFHGFSS